MDTVIFLKELFPDWKFGDGDAADICIIMASFSVRNFTKNFFLKCTTVSDIYEHSLLRTSVNSNIPI